MEKKEKQLNILKKVGGIGLIVLALQIPIMKLWDLLSERQHSQSGAIEQTIWTSGPAQTISGPIIQLPYLLQADSQSTSTIPIKGYTYISPDKLKISAKMITEVRQRGIFEVPTYSAEIDFSGTFSPSQLKVGDLKIAELLWSEATLTIGITEPKTIREQQAFEWNQNTLDFEPGSEAQELIGKGIHVSLPGLSGEIGSIQSFRTKLTIGGTDGLYFVPVGKSTDVTLTGDWSDPSFAGAFSPVTRETTADKFSANWKVSDLGGSFGRRTGLETQKSANNCQAQGRACTTEYLQNNFGVRLLSAVDTYRMVNRAVKYQLLIVVLTFTTFFMFELIYGLRLHPVQYFLVGLALVLFYLLLLSLSEHLGFYIAYSVASLSVIGLVAGYAFSVLNGKKGAITIIGAMSALYAYLFSALTSEDYALLTGSFGFTIVLGMVMYCTRNIDWYALNESKASNQIENLSATSTN